MQYIEFLVREYGVVAVCVATLLEGTGLPLPSYPVLLIAGAIALSSMAIPLVLLAAVAGALSADAVWYLAGARFGPGVLALSGRLPFAGDFCIRSAESRFSRVGPWALLFTKFVPGIGLAAIIFSGVTRVRLQRFLAFDALGSALYVGVPLVLGRVFHESITSLLMAFSRFGRIAIVLIAILIAGYVVLHLLQRRRGGRPAAE